MIVPLVVAVLVSQTGEYPKVVRKNGQVCVQSLNAAGAVEEACRGESEGEFRKPMPAAEAAAAASDAPYATHLKPADLKPPDGGQLHWAEAKRNWALAFKFSAVTTFTTALVSFLAAAVVSKVPGAADPYLVSGAVASGVCAISTFAAVMLDISAYEELYPPQGEH